MNKWTIGFISGFIATAILSGLMLLKAYYGFMPQFNVVQDFQLFFGSESRMMGWSLHFVIGTFIWGGLFAFLLPILWGQYWLKGIVFGLIAWLFMMVGYMPIMEHGLFAANLGMQVMFAALVLHVIFGFLLGLCFGLIRWKKGADIEMY